MTKEVFQSARAEILAAAKAGFGLISPEEIVAIVLRHDPAAEEREVTALLDACGKEIRIVEQSRKDAIVESLTPPKQEDVLVDLSMMDKMFRIVLDKKMPEMLRQEWYARLGENPRYRQILELRPDTEPEGIARSMGLTLPEVYFLEREMYNLYYILAWKYRK